jgi:mannose-6-phosphate isomerase-like protein (cupin superfamily)
VSYPEQRYFAEEGAVSATLRRAAQPADLVSDRTEISYLATKVSTDGGFGLYRYVMTEQPSGPSPHFHRTMSESFFILSGTVRLYDGDEWVDAAAGDFLYVPVGGIHAFRNESGARAEMLLLFAPGAAREAYFEGLVERAASGREFTEEEQTAFLREHDQYLV